MKTKINKIIDNFIIIFLNLFLFIGPLICTMLYPNIQRNYIIIGIISFIISHILLKIFNNDFILFFAHFILIFSLYNLLIFSYNSGIISLLILFGFVIWYININNN